MVENHKQSTKYGGYGMQGIKNVQEWIALIQHFHQKDKFKWEFSLIFPYGPAARMLTTTRLCLFFLHHKQPGVVYSAQQLRDNDSLPVQVALLKNSWNCGSHGNKNHFFALSSDLSPDFNPLHPACRPDLVISVS